MSATTAVFLGSAPYGAAELKAVYQRNFFVACCIAAALHLAIIGSYAGWLRMHPEREGGPFVPPRPGGGTQIDMGNWVPPPPMAPHVPGRGVTHRGILPAIPVTPVPVADSLAPQDPAVHDAPDPESGPKGPGGEGGVGPGRGIVSDPEEPPPVFRPVEREPVLIKAVLPRYPENARLAGIEGVVLVKMWVKMWVDNEGMVRQATVVRSTWDIFNEPALEAARQSLFRPAYMTGGAVSVWVTLPFRFRIGNAQ